MTVTRCLLHSGESFPRMWDQRKPFFFVLIIARIIPTYVGSTVSSLPLVQLSTNHSHVCGINSLNGVQLFRIDESFPRMWDQRLFL